MKASRPSLCARALARFGIWPKEVRLDDIKVALAASPLTRRMKRRVLNQGYETAERGMARHFVRKGDRILELGASAGILTSLMAKRAGNEGRVVAVEANPDLRPYFERQMALNTVTAELHNALCCPIWPRKPPEIVRTWNYAADSDSLSGKASEQPPASASGKTPEWTTAGQICAQLDFQPNMLVVDLEGSERIWAEHRPEFPPPLERIIAEFHPHLTGPKITGQCVQRVIEEGFQIIGMNKTVLAFSRPEAAP